jgi:hypothetical protein
MPNRLWTFDYTGTIDKAKSSTPLDLLDSIVPSLKPATSTQGKYFLTGPSKPTLTTIDVVNEYPWTYSKPGDIARAETPRIFLKEKRLKTNAFISSIAYSFANAAQGADNVVTSLENGSAGEAGKKFASVLKKLRDNFAQGAYWITGTAVNAVQKTDTAGKNPTAENVATGENVLTDLGNSIKDFYNTKAADENPVLESPILNAYKNLYPSEDTGWQYILPYFDDYYSSSNNLYGDDSNMNVLNLIKAGTETLNNIAGIAGAISQPFGYSFQEKAKFYNFPSEGEEFSFTFPLINTGNINFNQVIKNWQLIFLLLYQNKPARVNRNLVEPPVIYQAEIPGQKFYPFCYVTGIAVDFKGSRRELKFNLDIQQRVELESINSTVNPNTSYLPGDANNVGSVKNVGSSVTAKEFFAIIPDAYIIKITLKSLVAETRNFMAYTVLGKSSLASALTVDLDQQIRGTGSGNAGSSNIGGANIGNQSGANTPVNYQVGGWPDAVGNGQIQIPELAYPKK